MSMTPTTDPRSVPQLLSDLARELTTLFRKESQLIRAELSEKASQLVIGLGEAAAGAICLLVALNVLAGALVIALANLIGAGWAALVVGILLAAIGAFLIKRGASNMSHLTPERTVHQVTQDANLVKEHVG